MILTVLVIIFIASFITAVASAMGKCPLWVSVVLLCIAGLLEHLPLGK